jgi:hypothetical protein
MRKCIRCGSEMKENCGIRVQLEPNGLVVTDSEKLMCRWAETPKVAICPQCGEVSIYLEDTSKLKE